MKTIRLNSGNVGQYIEVLDTGEIEKDDYSVFNQKVNELLSSDLYECVHSDMLRIGTDNKKFSYVMLVDEEGLVVEKPVNPIASMIYAGDLIAGEALIVKLIKVGEPYYEFLTDEDVDELYIKFVQMLTHFMVSVIVENDCIIDTANVLVEFATMDINSIKSEEDVPYMDQVRDFVGKISGCIYDK